MVSLQRRRHRNWKQRLGDPLKAPGTAARKSARNAEKAMTALARFRQAQLEEGKVKERRPFLASECSDLPKAEKWRRQIISEISKKVAQIQNAGLGEFTIRDLNDEINKLLREKGHWEFRISELGRTQLPVFGPMMLDHEGKEVPGNRGYKYFGAARDLPGVRELFEKEPAPAPRKTRAELMKDVDAEYYGYRDEDDGVLLPLEAQYEKQAVTEAVQKWRTEASHLSGDKPQQQQQQQQQQEEEEEEESIYSVHSEVLEDEESGFEQEDEEGGVGFIAHVPVPSQKEVGALTLCARGGGAAPEEEDGAAAALRQRSSAGPESDGQSAAGTLSVRPPVCQPTRRGRLLTPACHLVPSPPVFTRFLIKC
ncbi:unnamed protein product [Tetraodon nigroviridis]|uniref:Pre-mRNA-splicing factor ISY1 homolog n=1 Tax=Tetraodon nigroviridis TaxID=99883 RepID=Q4T0J8_TETNG|nr:unnamed protein product [Tetraodon nigroviridis]